MASSDASSFTIEELSGSRRVVSLAGRALPHRPTRWSGTMRAAFTWYPGNPQATAQVLGAAEDETTFSGYWKDRFLKAFADDGSSNLEAAVSVRVDGSTPEDVMSLVLTVDSIRRQGQLCRVTWDEIVREGILTKFVQTWHNRHDVEWELSFQWTSQGEQEAPAAFVVEPDLSDTKSQLQSQLDDLSSSTSEPPFALPLAINSAVAGVVDSITTAIDGIVDTVQANVDDALSPVDSARRTLGLLNFVKEQSNDMIAVTESKVAGAFLETKDIADVTMAEVLRAELFNLELRQKARAMRAQAGTSGDLLAQRASAGPLLAAFVATQDTDLRDVSTRYYGTPDEWRSILVFNNLTSSKLTAGQLIFVQQVRGSES